MRRGFWAVLSVLAPAWAVGAPQAPRVVRFKAADGTPLVADYVAPKPGKPTLVLLHGVAAWRGEWRRLSAALAERGVGSLALDFRGHGESGGPKNETFRTTEAWVLLERDVEAALRFAGAQGRKPAPAGLVGASMGANLAARVAARQPRVPCLALLSSGIEYRGVGIEDALDRFVRPLWVASSPPDRYAHETAQFLRGLVPKAAFASAPGGHGAQMLEDPALLDRLTAWLEAACLLGRGD
ncbi:MAG: alpha/beta fold hydrolase [Elusimicrobia bacterium]|nr:alpha/beta fold hydrolase [Elusimicrobiota bacterium]